MLRAQAKNWMPLLLNTYVATPAVQRGQVERAVAAYACVCEPAAAAQFFRAAITKLIKASTGSPGDFKKVGLFSCGCCMTETGLAGTCPPCACPPTVWRDKLLARPALHS